MSSVVKYSVVVPVYNRPEELEELLKSLVAQSYKNFEVIIVEDGSTRTSEEVVNKFKSDLRIHYIFKSNSGPGPSRNVGFKKAVGDFMVVFDSDCILPPEYFQEVEKFFESHPLDAWGGPDRGHSSFTLLQQAMAYTMSSVLTTGGIRGNKNQGDKFQPRSFNMGMTREVFEKTGGFNFDRLAEDIELSIRMREEGFFVGLIPDAFVYHKRRTSLWQFFKQVQGFGRGRVKVGRVHPGAIKITHWFPSLFLLGVIAMPFIYLWNPFLGWVSFVLFRIYVLAIFFDAIWVTHSVFIALMAVPSAIVQLIGYGTGFLMEKFRVGT